LTPDTALPPVSRAVMVILKFVPPDGTRTKDGLTCKVARLTMMSTLAVRPPRPKVRTPLGAPSALAPNPDVTTLAMAQPSAPVLDPSRPDPLTPSTDPVPWLS